MRKTLVICLESHSIFDIRGLLGPSYMGRVNGERSETLISGGMVLSLEETASHGVGF